MGTNEKRVQPGVPAGGQFAAQERNESGVSLNPVQPARLAATGVEGPTDGYTVTGYQGHNTHDGVAFVAKLRKDGKIVGSIQNDGTGGDTWVNFLSRADASAFGELAARWTGTWGGADYQFPHTEESVVMALVAEAEVTKQLAKDLRRGLTPVLPNPGENVIDHGYLTARNVSAEDVWAKYPDARVWNGHEWVEAPR